MQLLNGLPLKSQSSRAGRQHQTGKDLDEDELVLPGQTQMNTEFLAGRGFVKPNSKSIHELKGKYNIRVAGKLLFQMLARFFGGFCS